MLPASAWNRIAPYVNRNLVYDPSGKVLQAQVLNSKPGSEFWRQQNVEFEAALSKDMPVIVVDDVFSPEALQLLLKFTHRSTGFHSHKHNGYMCSFWNSGFTPDLVMQAWVELQEALPSVLCKHALLKYWVYTYPDGSETTVSESRNGSGTTEGIGLHSDHAAVSVNCFLTPDDSITEAGTGGLSIYPKRPGQSSIFQINSQYEAHPTVSGHFNVKKSAASSLEAQELSNYARTLDQPMKVHHKQNRCVIFHSSLLHATAGVRSKPGLKNRRINLTFLGGLKGDTCPGVKKRSKQALSAIR